MTPPTGAPGSMTTDDRSRTLRAIFRTAALWSAAWGLAGGGIMAALVVIDPGPGVESLPERLGLAVFAAASWGVRFALAGSAIGAGAWRTSALCALHCWARASAAWACPSSSRR